jgi:tryptophan synthase alpha chain
MTVGQLGEAMAALRREGRKAFVPFLSAGDPSMERTRELWRALDRAGADVIEIGIPFSDPLADGPTIQRSSERALRAGTTLVGVLAALAEERASIAARMIVFTYYNPVLAMGLDEFARRAGEAGADGCLVPDLIPEEAGPLTDALAPRGIDPVFLVAPTTPDERLTLVGRASPALAYAVSVTGVTGARDHLPAELEEFVARCRERIASPLVVGFGISTPDEARRVARLADGVVVGSALVRIVEEAGDSPELVPRVEERARALAEAVKG